MISINKRVGLSNSAAACVKTDRKVQRTARSNQIKTAQSRCAKRYEVARSATYRAESARVLKSFDDVEQQFDEPIRCRQCVRQRPKRPCRPSGSLLDFASVRPVTEQELTLRRCSHIHIDNSYPRNRIRSRTHIRRCRNTSSPLKLWMTPSWLFRGNSRGT
jgi:hypothetical protein